MRRTRILLLGLMGAGKTTIGTALARELGWPYLDNDELVARSAGAAKQSLLQVAGVEALRAHETAALRVALTHPGPFVASVAAGVVLDTANVGLLATRAPDTALVWLRVPVAVLARRISAHRQDRPWLGADVGADVGPTLHTLAADREPRYAELADITVDAAGPTPAGVVAELAAFARG